MKYVSVRRLALVLLAGMIVAGGLLSTPWTLGSASAQAQPTSSIPRTITVVGEGKVNIRPDIARTNIGVEVVRNTVQEASAENKATLDAVLEALMAQGIDEKDIQTTGFSVYAERYGPEGPLAESDVRYRVSNNVNVKIRDLDSVGAVLDAAIEAGANNIYGVEFALDDISDAQSQARAKAVDNSAAKAQELADLSGVTLGPIVSLSEIIGSSGGFYSGVASQFGLGGGGGTPVSPGELEITYQIQAVYSIAD